MLTMILPALALAAQPATVPPQTTQLPPPIPPIAGPAAPLVEVSAHVQAGRLRAIAVTTARRSSLLPDVPTIAETIPGFEVTVVNYVCVRAGTPQPIIARLNEALLRVLSDPALDERMRAAGSSRPQGSTPEELGALLQSESAKWGEVIRRAGIHAG